MLPPETISTLAAELAEADRGRGMVPRITARHPEATIEDSYAIQAVWRDQKLAAGHRLVGRKIGLTSKAMQAATGITEPDYGVIFDDTVWENGATIPYDSFSNVRIEVELAFMLGAPLRGPDCTIFDVMRATEYVVPALEILNSHIEMEGRTIVDTIADNAAYGGLVVGGNPTRPDAVDLRWISALLYRNETIEETGVAAGVLNHPAAGVAWLANKLHQHDASLGAGELILAGSFTRPVWISRGDSVLGDYARMGNDRMPIPVTSLAPTFRDALAASDRPLIGMWACTGSPLVAEICAGSGLDWLLLDMEHAPNGLEAVLAQLQAVAGYRATPLVRVPGYLPVMIKQVLDLGAQNILMPMVDSVQRAQEAVSAVRYPPRGVRGVGSALARSARWNRVDDYLTDADRYVSLFVQIESVAGVENAAEIAAVDGVDGVFVGPSDLAASMGLIGQQTHPEVVAAVNEAFDAVIGAGKPVGVNAFDPVVAEGYLAGGASFVLVGADVAMLARSSEALAARFIGVDVPSRAGY